jgi:hypothetical protein
MAIWAPPPLGPQQKQATRPVGPLPHWYGKGQHGAEAYDRKVQHHRLRCFAWADLSQPDERQRVEDGAPDRDGCDRGGDAKGRTHHTDYSGKYQCNRDRHSAAYPLTEKGT